MISLTFLRPYSSTDQALIEGLQLPRSWVKKHLTKTQRMRPILARAAVSFPIDLINRSEVNPVFCGKMPAIVYEDQNFLIFNKPHQLHCHPQQYSGSDNCLSYLLEQKKYEVLKVNPSSYSRGLINRLDFETSGVLMAVKNISLFHLYRNQFEQKVKLKKYLAIVEGRPEDQVIIHHLRPSGSKGHKMKVSERGHRAQIAVKTLETVRGRSLIEVNLVTGVRHQIRAQLAAIGHAICGDTLYGGCEDNRLFLHAFHYQVSFEQEEISFRAAPCSQFTEQYGFESRGLDPEVNANFH